MKIHKLGIIMNGVTGRMGKNQHLLRSIVAIIRQGGVPIGPDDVVLPDPILVGRNADKLEELCSASGIARYATDLDTALSDAAYSIYFDAQITHRRADCVRRAIRAGKHVYCEKPLAADTASALELAELVERAGLKNGVVQDKLFLPGLIKLRRLRDKGFFGRILSVRGEFGYWVFEGEGVPAQRPSWNYRQEESGGIILDMLCHWRYVLDNLFGPIQAVSCRGATHIPERVDEKGRPYACTADDAAYATFELEGGVVAQFNSSWTTRVRRDDLLTLHVDGTLGSAVVGLRDCWTQHYAQTPRPVWNPDVEQPIDFRSDWSKLPEQEPFDNAFKAQWTLFLKHVVETASSPAGSFPWSFREGVKGVQLAELGLASWRERRWIDVPPLDAARRESDRGARNRST